MAKTGWYWPWLLTAAMSGVVVSNVWMAVVATSDANGSVVEPDYYRKAVRWDSTMAARAASDALGWTATSAMSADAAASAATPALATVHVTLLDAVQEGVVGADVKVTLIHNADAGRPTELALRELGDGRYGAEAPLARWGRWEVRVSATRGAANAAERFVAITHTDLVARPAEY
jgi:nitrogen fixation protein FixH